MMNFNMNDNGIFPSCRPVLSIGFVFIVSLSPCLFLLKRKFPTYNQTNRKHYFYCLLISSQEKPRKGERERKIQRKKQRANTSRNKQKRECFYAHTFNVMYNKQVDTYIVRNCLLNQWIAIFSNIFLSSNGNARKTEGGGEKESERDQNSEITYMSKLCMVAQLP